ncbi:MAG: GPW/gp25 family protein [Gemmatimonadota bacterium]
MKPEHGRHLAFPFRIGADGRTVQVASLEQHVRDELVQLVLTDLGERAFLPEFGGGARRLVFEPIDEATQGMTKARLTQAVSTWLGHRVTLEELAVTTEESTITVEIRYRIAGTEDSRVLRFQHRGGGT